MISSTMRRVILSILATFFIALTFAQNIDFKDAVVKSICVTQWDTDGDGELSMEEAADVASLYGVFSQIWFI